MSGSAEASTEPRTTLIVPATCGQGVSANVGEARGFDLACELVYLIAGEASVRAGPDETLGQQQPAAGRQDATGLGQPGRSIAPVLDRVERPQHRGAAFRRGMVSAVP